eukprot:1579965-Heterocapsa_arctica.AAC.1
MPPDKRTVSLQLVKPGQFDDDIPPEERDAQGESAEPPQEEDRKEAAATGSEGEGKTRPEWQAYVDKKAGSTGDHHWQGLEKGSELI